MLASSIKADIPNGLDLNLLKQLTSDLSANQAISPFILSSVMTQMWLAASGGTRDEVGRVCGDSEKQWWKEPSA